MFRHIEIMILKFLLFYSYVKCIVTILVLIATYTIQADYSQDLHIKCKTLVYFIMSERILEPSSVSGVGSLIQHRRLAGIRPGSSCLSGMAAHAVPQSPLERASAAVSPGPEHLCSVSAHFVLSSVLVQCKYTLYTLFSASMYCVVYCTHCTRPY